MPPQLHVFCAYFGHEKYATAAPMRFFSRRQYGYEAVIDRMFYWKYTMSDHTPVSSRLVNVRFISPVSLFKPRSALLLC